VTYAQKITKANHPDFVRLYSELLRKEKRIERGWALKDEAGKATLDAEIDTFIEAEREFFPDWLLFLDRFSGHDDPSIQAAARACRVRLIFLPANTTPFLQPLDGTSNREIKRWFVRYLKQWERLRGFKQSNETTSGKPRRATSEEIMGCILRAMAKVRQLTNARSWNRLLSPEVLAKARQDLVEIEIAQQERALKQQQQQQQQQHQQTPRLWSSVKRRRTFSRALANCPSFLIVCVKEKKCHRAYASMLTATKRIAMTPRFLTMKAYLTSWQREHGHG